MIDLLKRYLVRNPYDAALQQAQSREMKKFLFVWNRGLGDIPLGLYALVHRLKSFIAEAEVTFLTRLDLREGFAMLGGVETLVSPSIRRGEEFVLDEILSQLGSSRKSFDQIFEKPDPTRWLPWQIGTLTPRLQWSSAWDGMGAKFKEQFNLISQGPIIGVHVQTETNFVYNYEKNWPDESWRTFFTRATCELGAKVVLFGFQTTPQFEGQGIIDLRGRTSLIEMMSIIKNCCTHLVVPDSGVLSVAYYLDIAKPLTVISLWADPKQGVLRQKVASPNPYFKHYPLIGKAKDTSRIPVEAVMECLKDETLVCQPRTF